MPLDVPVLVVGGGPVGLATSICLSRCGVASLLVERHETTTRHPKASVVNSRSMELFRLWGIEDRVVAGGVPAERMQFVVWATSLAGLEIGRLALAARAGRREELAAHSPTRPVICAQDVVEPLLRGAAEDFATADVRFGTRLLSFAQDADGVDAEIEDVATGTRTMVRAAYLVAADGRASGVRASLGIPLAGLEPLGDMINIHFRADLTPWTDARPGPLYWIANPEVPGVFIALNGADRWLYDVPYDKDGGESAADFPPERCVAIVRRAAGVPDLDVHVENVSAWSMTRLVAERYRAGRVFLAGDAAHQFPPAGGFGMNCGIQDAHNLAWKLAAVLRGAARAPLLDSYDAERRPVAWLYTNASAANAQKVRADLRPPAAIEDPVAGADIRRLIAEGIESQRGHFDSTGLALGFAYASDAIVPDGSEAAIAGDAVVEYVPSARPGARAPHVWLASDAGRVSTLDLFDGGFALLAASRGVAWCAAANSVRNALDVPLRVEQVAPGAALRDPAGDFERAYGLAPDGAVLVRPDGHVAWRSAGSCDAPGEAVERALGCALGHGKGAP